MKRFLITGATGNVGVEVLRYLYELGAQYSVLAGVRNVDKAKKKFTNFPQVEYVQFDFERPNTFAPALENVDRLFLLRPPHLADIDKYFDPFFDVLDRQGVREIIFLSVQGAERSNVIPHRQIERKILEHSFDYIFLRPSYFMQNLTTTLHNDIRTKRKIILPAGKAVFNWIDVQNIGEVAALLMKKFEEYRNDAYDLTGLENENFYTVTKWVNEVTADEIVYKSIHPFRFYYLKRKEGLPANYIIVLILLHFLPRFQKPPEISDFYQRLTGKSPTTLRMFIERERDKFIEERKL